MVHGTPLIGEFLERTQMAIRYVVQAHGHSHHGPRIPLAMVVEAIFDVIGAVAASSWASLPNGGWCAEATVAEALALPAGQRSWDAFNLQAALSGQVVQPVGEGRHHIATANQWPDGPFRVLHVLVELDDTLLPAAQQFTRVITSLLFDLDRAAGAADDTRAADLSDRQVRILDLMATDKSYRQIGAELGYSESTVKQEVGRIFRHLGVRDRVAAVERAVAQGYSGHLLPEDASA